jgi:predicted adenine nucleotide alpha hydrolase (AANH) superfamily ATPase
MPEKFLLHVCCAPCGIAVIDELRGKYDLAVLFYNPNIYPEEEYLRRKREVIRVCEEWNIPMFDQDYEPERWDVAVKGLEAEPEGGLRCGACFRMRLFHTAEVAASRGFDRFGSTLTTGRNKKAIVITPIGEAAGKRSGVPYYPEDWKKHGREERSRAMVRERGIYRQNYCGCRYSQRKDTP